MDLFTLPLEDEEMSLWELVMPSMEDIEMQKSDFILATTHYEVKPRINLVAKNPFRLSLGAGGRLARGRLARIGFPWQMEFP
jgi:hypothetical protein